MVRKLALAVSIALGTLSVPVHALGLGELSSKSTLNQNFEGDITLLSVQPDELDTIRVKLADADAFSRAGVDRPFYLSLLKFEPILSGKGRPVVRVTSEFPIREPFMNFLIEVNWPNGRLLREYTVLLDPPTTTMRRPPKVVPAAKAVAKKPVAAKPAPESKPAPTSAPPVVPAPVAAAGPTEYGPVKANDTAWSLAKKLRPRGVSMEQMMMALLAANPDAFIDGNINRLRQGKILRVPSAAEINETSRQDARSAYRQQQDEWLARKDRRLQQAAAAEAGAETTQAEAGGTGSSSAAEDQLRIATARPEGEGDPGASEVDAAAPTSDDLKSRLMVARENAETSRQEAETLRTRVDDLQARLQDMQKLLSLKDEQLARLQDQVLTEAAEGAVESATDKAEATEETPAIAEEALVESTEGAADAKMDPVEQAMADAEMASSEIPAAAATLAPAWVPSDDYRLPDLAPQVDPDRIVEGGDALAAASVDDGAAPLEDIPVQVDPDKIVEEAAAQAMDATGMATEIGVEDSTPAAGAPVEETIVIEEAASAADVVAEVAAPVEAPQPAVASEAPVTAEPAAAEPTAEPVSSLLPPGVASMIEKNIVPIGGGAVALLAAIGWLSTRRRKEADEGAPAPVAAATAAGAVAENEAPAVDQPAVPDETLNDLPDSAFLDEFSPSDFNALQDETGEVDPVSEADVYIAYGRYQQAEELLRQALTREPDRLALKHKLLEVHYATRDAEAFSALAQEMADAGQDSADDDAWVRAQDMGRELAPANPLFAAPDDDLRSASAAAGVAAAALGAAAASSVDRDTLDLNELEISDLADEYDVSKDSVENLDAPSEVSITLDLDDEPVDQAGAAPADETRTADSMEPLSLDDMESIDFELPDAEQADKLASESVEQITDSLDLDSMMAEAETAISDVGTGADSEFSADDLQAQLDELSDLSVLDAETAPAANEEAPATLGLVSEDQTSVEEALDRPMSLDTAFDAAEADESMPETIELDELNEVSSEDEDDVATKLDLARAYVDMGDDDGARSILDEVMSEGNATQKGEAEKLLAQL